MNDYMKALHQRFFREPEYPDIRLGMGIAGELEPYNFEDEEEERCQRRLEEFERRSLAQKGE